MKTKSKLFLLTLSFFAFIVSCGTDSDSLPIIDKIIAEEPIDEVVPTGTVSLNTLVKDRVEVQTGKTIPDEVLDYLIIEIYDESGDLIVYIENSGVPEFVELVPGEYQLSIYSSYFNFNDTSIVDTRFDFGAYESDLLSFVILQGQNTIVDVVLNLLDVAVTIDYEPEILTNYPDILSYLEIINTSINAPALYPLEWQADDNGRVGYYPMKYNRVTSGEVIEGDLRITIVATNSLGNRVEVIKTYPDVKANEHYKITISYTQQATASLVITLDDEVIIEDEINFPN